jgi:hypothetical protein
VKIKKYIVQFRLRGGTWSQSSNTGADGKYIKESAERRARQQAEKVGLKYRIKEIK